MHIGVFDSGNGGTFVAERLSELLPEHTYHVVSDPKHAPYGERSYEEINHLTHAAIRPLISSCPIIIIACNTATVASIDFLRISHPATKFIGFEPMIKPAALSTKSRHITLLATHATARSTRTRQLIDSYAENIRIDIPNTKHWARLVDANRPEEIDLREVEESVNNGSDTVIIGCTHYIAVLDQLKSLDATILEPTEAVAQRLTALVDEQLRQ